MSSNEDVVNEHVRSLLARDWDAFFAGYADDAVLLAGPAPVIGKDAIRAALSAIPDDALPHDVDIDSMTSQGEYTYLLYRHSGMKGGDTFHIRDGKIVMQSAHLVTP